MDEARPSRSWSQYTSFRKCGEAYRLERMAGAKSRPGPWLPAGTAVHVTIEAYLRDRLARGLK